MKKEKTWSDLKLKIGDTLRCIDFGNDKDFLEQHLTIGKQYIIEDLEYHFPNSVCVKTDNNVFMFFKIKIFLLDIKSIRKKKLLQITKKK